MSENSITIKPANHLIYQCPHEKKIALIEKIISENDKLDILLVCSSDIELLQEKLATKKITILEDKELFKNKDLKCELLISYDMPIKAIVYMSRVSRATKKAIMLLAESEQKDLYSVETLLGRVIKQEVIEDFLYVREEKSAEPIRKKLSKEAISEIAKQRHLDATVEKKPKVRSEDGKWDKKKKAPNQFLGKDDNGKAIFSGKSGDRNHRYDGTPKERYAAPKKVGKKINIKARKEQD